MKKIILAASMLISTFITTVSGQELNDTTILFNNKVIVVQDSLSRLKVKVMVKDSLEYKTVYEGIFTDVDSFENVNVMEEIGFNFPFIKKKKRNNKMEAHWAGFSYGKLTTSDNQMHLGVTNGVPLDKGKSNEVMLNIFDGILPVIGHTFGITSGFGLNWRSYHFDNNTHLMKDADGVTKVFSANAGINYTYSRLRTLHLTIPVLLEWQPLFGKNKEFFMSAGVIGGWNVMSTYRVKYVNADGDKINKVESHGLNTNTLSLDFMGQIGYSDISIYAKYSPFGIFQNGKGPDINAASLGLEIHF